MYRWAQCLCPDAVQLQQHHSEFPMKPLIVSLFLALTTTILTGCAQSSASHRVYPGGSTSYSSTTSTEYHVSRPGPSWQGNNFYDHPIAAGRVNPVRTYRSETLVDLGVFQHHRVSERVASPTVIMPDGRSVTEVTRYGSTQTSTRPQMVYPTTSYGGFIGVQPSYVDNTSGRWGGGSFGSSSVTVTPVSPYRALGR